MQAAEVFVNVMHRRFRVLRGEKGLREQLIGAVFSEIERNFDASAVGLESGVEAALRRWERRFGCKFPEAAAGILGELVKPDSVLARPCKVCGVTAGEPCKHEDGTPGAVGRYHAGRVVDGLIILQRTGETAGGEGVFEARSGLRPQEGNNSEPTPAGFSPGGDHDDD